VTKKNSPKQIPGSRLVVFKDAGHGVWRDKPEEALAVIREFISTPETS